MRNDNPDAGQSSGLGTEAILGECAIMRESDITGDERCKQKFACRLTVLEAKYAFLDAQSLEQMVAGDAKSSDAMATLDFEEFLECIARLARDKCAAAPSSRTPSAARWLTRPSRAPCWAYARAGTARSRRST